MARVQCKDEAHDGDTAWVDREDCLLVQRSVGGAYNRAARMQDSLICLACASRIVASIEAQGGPRGHRLHNRWSISSLQNAYARFRRSRGLEPKDEIGGRPKYIRVEGQQIRVELGARTPESWEVLATVKEDVPVERASTAVRVAWGTDVVEEIGVHEGRRIFKARVARLDGGRDDSERADIHEAMDPTRDEAEVARLKELADPELKGEALTQEEYFGDDLALEPGGDPSPRSYDEMPVAHLNPEPGRPNLKPLAAKYIDGPSLEELDAMRAQDEEAKAVVGMIPDTPLSDLVRRWFGPSPMEEASARLMKGTYAFEPKTEPSPDVPQEVAEEQARFEASHPGLSPEAARVVEEQARGRIRRGLPDDAVIHPLITGEPTTSAADLLRAIRERQGRPLHEARHLNALPDVPKGRMQVSYPFLQTDPIPGRVRMQDVADRDTALAYGGLVPRKAGEFHHHFEGMPGAQATCVFCGANVYAPCKGPRWEEWEARMQERRELKERVFYLAYGVSKAGNREAARHIREFDTETLRLFPERFREPTAEELKHREEFQDMLSRLTQGQFTPLTEAEERYLAKARRQQDELNEQIRAAREAAWEEGRHAGVLAKNPYRKADDE